MNLEKAAEFAKNLYAKYGVDADKAVKICNDIPISIHCWQGDDVGGFENTDSALTGGIQATGNYPGKARTIDQLMQDIEQAFRYIPGAKKINLHAIYLDNQGQNIDRNQIEFKHFEKWAEFANRHDCGIDFNGTFFSHPYSADGFTLSSPDDKIRNFWIEHGKRVRRIAGEFAKRTGKPCVNNIWIPDGDKEVPVDTLSPRLRLKDSLDKILSEKIDGVVDAVECKLFGIGSEAYVVGSHEFYMGYVLSRREQDVLLTFDTGHFHPTEQVSSKISAVMPFTKELLLHVSRPVRWDSDHVVNFDDETRAIMSELVRTKSLDRTYIALDYFDASVNRIVAWTVGARNTRKALLEALLEPVETLKELEKSGDRSFRMAMAQEIKSLPLGIIWDEYCAKQNAGVECEWFNDVRAYEKEVLSKR